MHSKTKIICTIGPSVIRYTEILELIDAGMNVARLNFSHGTHEEHLRVIELLKKARDEKQVPLAIMLDTKGPEIRVGVIPEGVLRIMTGETFTLTRPSKKVSDNQIIMTPENVFDCLKEGITILFDDGYIKAEVIEITQDGIKLEAKNSGVLRNNKGVNIPGVKVPLPAMTQQDIDSITFGCNNDIDIIAASFIRSESHVLEIRDLLQKLEKPDTLLISKIEDVQGVENFESILAASDGIMVARGDLGVEMPLEEVPYLQKKMIQSSYSQGKPVIIATQMLESMINNPRPTRAEVSDVANAIYDSASAVMLSGETAIGQYPIEAVRMMRKVIVESESHFRYKKFLDQDLQNDNVDISNSIALASVKTAYTTKASAIFAFTNSGASARNISRFRPEIPILALTPYEKTYNQLALIWGVTPIKSPEPKNIRESFLYVMDYASKKKIVKKGDRVVLTAGEIFGVKGTTNTMIVENVP